MAHNDDLVERLIAATPSPRQLAWQKMEYYNFVHFGINTFTVREWGRGNESPSLFNPTALDTDQWCAAFAASGSKGVILTAKHHDGFCLWQTETTEHSIKNSPYKDGKGDVVAELAASCKKYGLKLGLYLSPWDRNCPLYGSDAYNDFYCRQLTELLSNYGPLFSVWFDGACGEGPDGKKQVYDFQRYYALIRKLQPDACITICGPDVRWIGNEEGKARDEEWSVVPAERAEHRIIAQESQQTDAGKLVAGSNETFASRDCLSHDQEYIWYPAEMDVPITTKCWFYRKSAEILHLRSVKNLCKLYYDSVGHNAALLLNVPADRRGLLPDRFVKRLKQFGERIKQDFSKPILAAVGHTEPDVYRLKFSKQAVRTIVLQEDIAQSQRVEEFSIYAGGKRVYHGKTIGYKQICRLDRPCETDRLDVKIERCRSTPKLLPIKLFG